MRQRHIILIAVLMTLLPSCILEMEVTPAQPDTVELTLCGDIVVPESALGADAVPTKADAVPTIDSLRVLVFDASGSLVSNTLFNSGWTEPQLSEDGKAYISSISGSKEGRNQILASVGTNYVYLVVNERVGGKNLMLQLQAVKSKAEMENIRTTKVEYTDLIPVNDAAEPPFLMCVYDEVTVLGGQVTQLDITGLSTSNPIYGFPMRRTMAKIILDSVTGGVDVNGNIVGTTTTTKWDGNASVDQIKGDTDNDKLKATSAIHILGLELVNVPKYYSWEQNKNNTYPTYSPELGYRADPIPVASFTGQNSSEYFAREWNGSITVSGTVTFTRIDQLADIWKVESQSGNSYVTVPLSGVNNLEYYNWAIIPNTDHGETHTIEASDADKSSYNYSHYTMDSNGIVTLYDTSGNELKTPSKSKYSLNLGDFTSFFTNTYSNNSTDNYIPGTPVAGKPEVTPTIDPAVWVLNFDDQSYYIPENIPGEEGEYTKLRITASIAIPTAKLSEEEINNALNGAGAGSLVQDEAKLNLDSHNIQKYLFAKGTMVRYPLAKPGDDTYYRYAMRYAGLSRKFEGSVSVKSGSKGQYDAITGMTAQTVTIEVPLNNGNLGSSDNNIYRGREYHVNLYFTDAITIPATRSGEDTNSVTFNVDGQEYALTASVSVK